MSDLALLSGVKDCSVWPHHGVRRTNCLNSGQLENVEKYEFKSIQGIVRKNVFLPNEK